MSDNRDDLDLDPRNDDQDAPSAMPGEFVDRSDVMPGDQPTDTPPPRSRATGD